MSSYIYLKNDPLVAVIALKHTCGVGGGVEKNIYPLGGAVPAARVGGLDGGGRGPVVHVLHTYLDPPMKFCAFPVYTRGVTTKVYPPPDARKKNSGALGAKLGPDPLNILATLRGGGWGGGGGVDVKGCSWAPPIPPPPELDTGPTVRGGDRSTYRRRRSARPAARRRARAPNAVGGQHTAMGSPKTLCRGTGRRLTINCRRFTVDGRRLGVDRWRVPRTFLGTWGGGGCGPFRQTSQQPWGLCGQQSRTGLGKGGPFQTCH